MSECSSIIEVDPSVASNKKNVTQPDSRSEYQTSSYGSYESSVASVAFSIDEYRVENGRLYHTYFGDNKNPLPVDEIEQQRLDVHHEVFLRLLHDRLYLAPLKDPQRILDIGTGSGIWAVEMADKFPKAEVIGTDLSPVQPACHFEIDDAEMDFSYQSDWFDFIHIRNLAQAITNWPALLSEVYRCTKPGGFVEFAELGSVVHSDDNTLGPNNGVQILCSKICEAMSKAGRRSHMLSSSMREDLQNAGFIDIHKTDKKQPLGPWPKDPRLKQVGSLALVSCEAGFYAYGMDMLTRVLGMSAEEAVRYCNQAVKHAKDKQRHTYSYL
ncbi:S-adenosyl-L-methionine-dependent methyltransferase [Trichophaea hybrida]|nr:S-adenosyl-L-methionine-dependent methyltransferase [Trichophaea hybrida]